MTSHKAINDALDATDDVIGEVRAEVPGAGNVVMTPDFEHS